jgi:hypothetical protein
MRKITKPASIVESGKSSTKKAAAKTSHAAHRSSKAALRPERAENRDAPSQKPKATSSAAQPADADAPASEPATAGAEGPISKKKRAPKAKGRPPQEVLDLMWEWGDLFNFLRALAHAPPNSIDRAKEFQRVLRLIRRRAAAAPEELVRDVLKSGETIITYLILRLENQILDRLREFDANFDHGEGEILPQEFFDRILPHWIEMQRHLGQLALSRASVSRQMGLVRAKQLENDRLERELKTLSTSAVPIDGSPSAQEAVPTAPQAQPGQTEQDVEDMFGVDKSLQGQIARDVKAMLRGE